jgi:SAM-dependent methyltransferase
VPLADGMLDLIVCQPAFKNFGAPLRALEEMHRVLRPGGLAVIQDMGRDCPDADIAAQVRTADVRGWNGFMMGRALRSLRRRAYSVAEFRRLAAASAFGGCEIVAAGIGMEVRLQKPA